MIIKGGSRCAGAWWSKHLQNAEKNERVSVIEFKGLLSDNIADALREMEAVASGTQCKNYFYHANINPQAHEVLTPEQWTQAVDRLEKNLGYEGLPRFVVEHEKEGRSHQHIIWSRIDPDLMIARSDSLTYPIHERTSRELEIALQLEPYRSVLVADRDFERPERRPKDWETFRGKDSGLDPKEIAAQVRELYAQADNGKAFAAALDEAGYTLCRGDQRVYCILDQSGEVHSLGRRLNVKAPALRDFMQDVALENLPSVPEAKEQWRERDQAQAHELERTTPLTISHEPEALPSPTEARKAPAREAPETPDTQEIAQHVGEVAGMAASFAGNMLGGVVVHVIEPLLGALADFFTGGSAPTPPPRAPQPQRTPPPAAPPTPNERLRRLTPEVASREPETRERARYEFPSMPQALQEELRRQAEEMEARRRERDRSRER